MRFIVSMLICCGMLLFLSCEKDPVSVVIDYSTATSSLAGRIFPAAINACVTAIQGDVSLSDSCDADGDFQMSGLKPGSCLVQVTATGYGMYRTTVTLPAGGLAQVWDIILQKFPYPVRSASPGIQSEWNSTASIITLNFVLPMDTQATAGALSIQPPIDGDTYWSADFTQLNVKPFSSLRTGTRYTVTLDTAAKTIDNRHLEFNLSYFFTTEPFRVTNVYPSDGLTGADLTLSPYIGFSALANQASVEASLTIVPAESLLMTWSGNYLYFKPARGYWNANTEYTVTLDTNATDIWNTRMIAPSTFSFSTVGIAISGITPADSAVNVSLASNISIEFSTVMDKPLTQTSFSLKDSLNNAVMGTIKWSTDDRTLVFTPARSLKSSMSYSIALDTNARDLNGNAITDSIEQTHFMTEPFALTSVYPANGGTNIGLSESARLYFNTDCSASSVEQSIYTVPSTALSFTWYGTAVYVSPQGGYWKNNTAYKLIVRKTAADAQGGTLADSTLIGFTTAAGAISSITPYDLQKNVTLSSSVNIYFETSMDPVSAASAFSLYADPDSALTGLVTWSNNNTFMSFGPIVPLRPATNYTVVIDSSATDLYGGKIGRTTITFTTEHMGVNYPYPSNNTGNVDLSYEPYFYFNAAGDAQSISDAFSIDPAIDVQFRHTSNYFYFKPRQGYWKSNAQYTVTIDTSAHDVWGKPMAVPYTYVFYTQAATVAGISPSYNETNVNVAATVNIAFNTNMDPASVAGAFILADSATATPVAGTMTGSGTSFSFTPGAALPNDTQFIVTVGPGATDTFGSAMTSAWTSTFRTQP